MHPIMSEIDLSVRHFERELERKAVQRRLFVADVTCQLGKPGLATRMAHAVRQFIDPRGFALAQYRHGQPQETSIIVERPAKSTATPIRTLPVTTTTFADVPEWRKAA